MDLSFRKAIEIVLDTLDEPDESVVAKKHNVDVEAVKFFSNDPIIAVPKKLFKVKHHYWTYPHSVDGIGG